MVYNYLDNNTDKDSKEKKPKVGTMSEVNRRKLGAGIAELFKKGSWQGIKKDELSSSDLELAKQFTSAHEAELKEKATTFGKNQMLKGTISTDSLSQLNETLADSGIDFQFDTKNPQKATADMSKTLKMFSGSKAAVQEHADKTAGGVWTAGDADGGWTDEELASGLTTQDRKCV